MSGGIRAASRDLGVNREDGRRATKVDSLTDAAKAAAQVWSRKAPNKAHPAKASPVNEKLSLSVVIGAVRAYRTDDCLRRNVGLHQNATSLIVLGGSPCEMFRNILVTCPR